jgi:hypothetical protein
MTGSREGIRECKINEGIDVSFPITPLCLPNILPCEERTSWRRHYEGEGEGSDR